MAYLLKIDNIDDHLAHVLMERGATYTEIDLDYAFISETSITGEWSHLYRPTEGRINEKNAIVNFEYEEILKGIKKNYKDYIGHIIPDRILIIEDTEWEQKETSSDNSSWKITIAKVPKMLQEITGWDYIIKTRKFWTQHMDNAQKAAMIFAELIRIDKEDGSITNSQLKAIQD